jgi:hypothetical protein
MFEYEDLVGEQISGFIAEIWSELTFNVRTQILPNNWSEKLHNGIRFPSDKS